MQEVVNIINKRESTELYNEVDCTIIFETYYKRIYNYVYYRINSHHSAEDLVSQIFEKVVTKMDTYDKEKAPFEVWLFGIAKNVVNDYFRDLKKHKFFSIDSIKELESNKDSPEDIVVTEESNEKLFKALKSLDVRERNIIALKFGANIKNIEIAEILNLTESNVGVILYRTMKKLKKELEKEEQI